MSAPVCLLPPLSPLEAKRKLDAGEAILIDVREADEFARAHIIGARLAPLSAIDAHDFDGERAKTAIFHCRSGNRTEINAAQLLAKGFSQSYALVGGLEGWKQAGLPVSMDRRPPLEIMRQVQITAGLLILLGIGLGFLVNPGFFGLAGFVGAGLTFAGVSGWCGMAKLLAVMPWNQPRAA
jgi:rhodanese-related sulfurtransferase